MDEYVWIAEDGEYSGRYIAGVYKDPKTYMDLYPQYIWTLHDEDENNIYWGAHTETFPYGPEGRKFMHYQGDITKTKLE